MSEIKPIHQDRDPRLYELSEAISKVIYERTAGTNITVAAIVGILEEVKLEYMGVPMAQYD